MAPPTRRALLGASATAAALLAGCASVRPGEESGSPTTETATTEATATPSPIGPSTLGVEASVVSGATEDRPAVVENVVTNEADRVVHLLPHGGGGHALDHPIRLADEAVELVLLPDGYPGLSEEPIDGCWRFAPPEGDELGTRTVVSTSLPIELRPGQRRRQTYEVYQDGSAEACFPQARYRATWSLDISAPDGGKATVDLAYTLTVDEDGALTVEVDGPTETG